MKRVILALTLVVVGARLASAQPLPGGSITVAGANCSVVQRCVDVDVTGLASIGIYLNVATSGTFVHEASLDATDVSSGTWFAINDDAGNANTTADAAIFFTNPGYKRIRLRASAINGTATVTVYQGVIGMRSTATLSGGGDASAANQTTQITHLSAIETAVEGTLVVGDGAGALNVICDSGCTGGTAIAHSGALTIGTTTGAPAMFRASAAAPSAVGVVDDDAVHPWALATGAGVTQPSFAGVLGVAGSGVNGTGVQRFTLATDDELNDDADTIATNSATIAGDTTDIETAIELIDNAANQTPADNFANPTGALVVWSLNGCFDGSTWDRCPTSTGGSGTIDANTGRVTIATDDEVNNSLDTLDNIVSGAGINVTQLGGAAIPMTTTQADDLANTLDSLNTSSFGYLFDGTTWDRWLSGAGTLAGSARVNIATDDDVSDAATLFEANLVANDAADAGSPLKIGGYASTTPPTAVSAAGDRVNAWYTLNGAATIVPAGGSVHYRTAAGSTEDEHEIKATAGTLYSVLVTNTNAAARYIRCYNLTAANTTPGTSTVFWGAAIPGNTAGAGFAYSFPGGLTFDTALTCAWTTGAADTDVAEVAANEIKATYTYR